MSGWYYLSEMAVSSRHGGGLTLQRVLQDDLAHFDRFVHLSGFATNEGPIIPSLASRQLNLHELVQRPGGTTSYDSWQQHLSRGWSKLKGESWIGWADDWWVHECARRIAATLPLKGSRWLIVPQSQWAVRVANALWRRHRVEYVTWLMDDHVVRWNQGWVYPEGYEARFRTHLQRAASVVAISDAMANEYARRFGVRARVVFGPADPDGEPIWHSPDPGGPVRLCYFGAVAPWQHDALAMLVEALPAANAELDIFGFHATPESLRSARVRVQTPIPSSEVIARMRTYDGVVIAASFREELRHLSEFNTATKLSECYGSGTVPIIVAPPYAAMAGFARAHGGALVTSSVEELTAATGLVSLKRPDARARLLQEARRVALDITGTAAMRRVWELAWRPAGAGARQPMEDLG